MRAYDCDKVAGVHVVEESNEAPDRTLGFRLVTHYCRDDSEVDRTDVEVRIGESFQSMANGTTVMGTYRERLKKKLEVDDSTSLTRLATLWFTDNQ